MPTENRSIPIHADDEAAILKMHSAFLDHPVEGRTEAAIQLQDEAYALGRARGKADQAEQDQGEYPPCDYCGIVPDYHPWHGSGLLGGVENRHIHACEGCRGELPAHPGQHQGEPVAWMIEAPGRRAFEFPQDARAAIEEWRRTFPNGDPGEVQPLYTHAEPAKVGQLRKEAESYKQHTLNAAITIGQICEALGVDDHSEPDMIIDAAKSMAEGMHRIAKECALGTPGFAIACEVLGELGIQQGSTDPEAKS